MDIPFDIGRYINAQIRCVTEKLELFEHEFDPQVRPADPRHGDYQANGILPYAKRQRTNPRKLGETLQQALETYFAEQSIAITIEIAGPGFLNFRILPQLLQSWLQHYSTIDALKKGAGTRLAGKTIIIDYPSPNAAKQMHIGHLRPIVIGEAIYRLIEFSGANVIRDDHLGDWGTNFGTLIMAIKHEQCDIQQLGEHALAEIERLYKLGTAMEKNEPSLRDISRNELLKLQQGDPENTLLWKQIVALSQSAFNKIYQLLDMHDGETHGESFYRDQVERIYEEMEACDLSQESEGALVIFHPEHPRFAKQPFMIRKTDGASNYATTDLATILYRTEHFKADEVAYVTDGRQQDHFQQLFITVKKWYEKKGYPMPKLQHVWFGTILGEDGKAIKTRSGDPILLKNVLDEGQEKALAIVEEKNPALPTAEKQHIAKVVGISAIRYADLSQNRSQDYVFSWQKLLSFDGNTAPYLLYAVARIHAIFRKADIDTPSSENGAKLIEEENECTLARKLAGFPSAIDLALAELRPHFLCTYLYELAGAFSSFYNANRILVDAPEIRSRRLMLCRRTALFLETGLRLLGIEPLKRM